MLATVKSMIEVVHLQKIHHHQIHLESNLIVAALWFQHAVRMVNVLVQETVEMFAALMLPFANCYRVDRKLRLESAELRRS